MYLERDKRTGGKEGEHKSHQESLARLEELGLAELDGTIEVLWSREEECGEAARSSVLMRTIVVNKTLDSEEVSDLALDLAFLKHLTHIGTGFLAE